MLQKLTVTVDDNIDVQIENFSVQSSGAQVNNICVRIQQKCIAQVEGT